MHKRKRSCGVCRLRGSFRDWWPVTGFPNALYRVWGPTRGPCHRSRDTDRGYRNRWPIRSRGFSLLEMMACTAILLIAAVAVGPVVVGGQRMWQNTNEAVASALVRSGREARMTLQRVVRRASLQNVTLDPDGRWVDLPYYSSPVSTQVDRYARLAWSEGGLRLQEGQIDPDGVRQTLSETVLCANVSAGLFTQSGASVRMKLTLTQGATQMTVAAGAVANNP